MVSIDNAGTIEVLHQIVPLLSKLASISELETSLASSLKTSAEMLMIQVKVPKPNQPILQAVLKEVWGQIKTIPAATAAGLLVEQIKPLLEPISH